MSENEYSFEITEHFLAQEGFKESIWYEIAESDNELTLKFIDYIFEFEEGYFRIEITFCYSLMNEPKHWKRIESPTIEIIVNHEAISISKANRRQLLTLLFLFKTTR